MTSVLKVDTIQSSGGTTGLTINSGGIITPSQQPIFHVTKSADQSLTDATTTLITFDEVTDGSNGGRTINKGGLFANNKLTVTADTVGYYWVYCSLFFQATQNHADVHGYFKVNGDTTHQIVPTNAGYGNSLRWGTFQNHQVIHLPNSGDYVELYMYADIASGGTLNINQNSTSSQRTNMGGWRIG